MIATPAGRRFATVIRVDCEGTTQRTSTMGADVGMSHAADKASTISNGAVPRTLHTRGFIGDEIVRIGWKCGGPTREGMRDTRNTWPAQAYQPVFTSWTAMCPLAAHSHSDFTTAGDFGIFSVYTIPEPRLPSPDRMSRAEITTPEVLADESV